MPTYNFSGSLNNIFTSSIDLDLGTTYSFTIISPLGSSYFTLETPSNYDGTTPPNLSGSISNTSSISTFNQDDYKAGFVLPLGTSSFDFTPSTNVTGSTLRLRGEGVSEVVYT